jgi:hypothetical protein
VPFLVVLLAAFAFAGSLALDWVGATGSFTRSTTSLQEAVSISGATISTNGQHVTIEVANNVTSLDALGLLYGLGGFALLGLGFAALSRPDQALRLRMATTGVGLGVLGVVAAAAVRLPQLLMANGAIFAGGSVSSVDRSFRVGVFCAFAAAALPVVAVWIRSAAAAQALVAPPAPVVPAPATPPTAEAWKRADDSDGSDGRPAPGPDDGWRRRSDPPAPYDLTVTPDD